MAIFEGDLTQYYAWFVKKRYGVTLNRPLRGSHVTVVSEPIPNPELWDKIKKKWDGKECEFIFDLNTRTNGEHWWLKADSPDLWEIRKDLELDKPYWSPHLTIGYANERNIDHSNYIHSLIVNFGGGYCL